MSEISYNKDAVAAMLAIEYVKAHPPTKEDDPRAYATAFNSAYTAIFKTLKL